MLKRLAFVVVALVIGFGPAGCADEKPTIPTKMLEPSKGDQPVGQKARL